MAPHVFSPAPIRTGSPSGAARRRALGRAVVVTLLLGVAAARAAAGPCPTADVWVASSRRLPGVCRLPQQAALDVERLSAGDHGRWEQASVADLLAEPGLPLVVFVHGNRYAPAEAKSQGVRLARLIAAAGHVHGPVRTVIFSWPSEQEGVLLRDVRAKYDRAHADGHHLAALLGRVEPDRPVAIVGHSYGALVGLEAIRDLVDEARAGSADVVPWAGRPGRTHLVLVAPAIRCDALAPRGPYRQTLACIDRLTLVVNSSDCALRFFPCVDRGVRAEALGATAMPRRWLPADVEYGAVDAAGIVGVEHRLPLYLDSAPLVRRITAGAVADLATPVGE
jgi:esterase/lipase superfamily enzyme